MDCPFFVATTYSNVQTAHKSCTDKQRSSVGYVMTSRKAPVSEKAIRLLASSDRFDFVSEVLAFSLFLGLSGKP
jgi:hypothetical protein